MICSWIAVAHCSELVIEGATSSGLEGRKGSEQENISSEFPQTLCKVAMGVCGPNRADI